jgi:hypothetical protein
MRFSNVVQQAHVKTPATSSRTAAADRRRPAGGITVLVGLAIENLLRMSS